MNDNKLAFNTKQAVEILGINRNILDIYRKKGLIRCIKIGRNYIYPKSELEQFLKNNLNKEISKEGIILVG